MEQARLRGVPADSKLLRAGGRAKIKKTGDSGVGSPVLACPTAINEDQGGSLVTLCVLDEEQGFVSLG